MQLLEHDQSWPRKGMPQSKNNQSWLKKGMLRLEKGHSLFGAGFRGITSKRDASELGLPTPKGVSVAKVSTKIGNKSECVKM